MVCAREADVAALAARNLDEDDAGAGFLARDGVYAGHVEAGSDEGALEGGAMGVVADGAVHVDEDIPRIFIAALLVWSAWAFFGGDGLGFGRGGVQIYTQWLLVAGAVGCDSCVSAFASRKVI